MIYGIIAAILLGMGCGYLWLSTAAIPILDEVLLTALSFMVFVAGIEIGGNRHIIKKICNPKGLTLMVAIPTAVVIGSLVGGGIAGTLTGMKSEDAVLVSAGLGWYSLSSVVISSVFCSDSFGSKIQQNYEYWHRWCQYHGFYTACHH